MIQYREVLKAALKGHVNASKNARLALYAHARCAMIERLSDPFDSLSDVEIAAEIGHFDRAVADVEAQQEAIRAGLVPTNLPIVAAAPDGNSDDATVLQPSEPIRTRSRVKRRSFRARAQNGLAMCGAAAVVALVSLRLAQPLPGHLQIRVRWDQLLASPLRAESFRLPAEAQASVRSVAAVRAGAAPAAEPKAALPPSDLREAALHDVSLSHLPRIVANPLRAGEIRLKNYRLREVFDEFALIEAPSGVAVIRRGESLGGAGEVTSIELRDQSWVVTTTGGVIE